MKYYYIMSQFNLIGQSNIGATILPFKVTNNLSIYTTDFSNSNITDVSSLTVNQFNCNNLSVIDIDISNANFKDISSNISFNDTLAIIDNNEDLSLFFKNTKSLVKSNGNSTLGSLEATKEYLYNSPNNFSEGIQTVVESSSGASISMNHYEASNSNGPRLVMRKNYGDFNTLQDLSLNTILGSLWWEGYNNGAYRRAAQINTYSGDNTSGSNVQGYTDFKYNTGTGNVTMMSINKDSYPLTLTRFAGSSGNQLCLGDSAVTGGPKINIFDDKTGTNGTQATIGYTYKFGIGGVDGNDFDKFVPGIFSIFPDSSGVSDAYPAFFRTWGYGGIGIDAAQQYVVDISSSYAWWGTSSDNAPSYWTNYGNFASSGAFNLALSWNGFRNVSNQWSSMKANSNSGPGFGGEQAGLLTIDSTGLNFFASNSWPTGSSSLPKPNGQISGSLFQIDPDGGLSIPSGTGTPGIFTRFTVGNETNTSGGSPTSNSWYLGTNEIDGAAVGNYSAFNVFTQTAYYLGQNSPGRRFRIGSGSLWSTIGVELAAGANSWGTFSDARLKDICGNIVDGLSKITQLNPVTFNYKEDPSGQALRFGFIAQEVQPIFPEIINADNSPNHWLSMQEEPLIPWLVACIKQLNEKITTLESRIESLENP